MCESGSEETLYTLVDPWCDVERIWKQTFDVRQNEFEQKHWSIDEYIDKYACLKEPNGILLVILI